MTFNVDQAENANLVYKMLARNGFPKQNIQLFYGGNIGSKSELTRILNYFDYIDVKSLNNPVVMFWV